MEDILASIRRIIADDQSRSMPVATTSFRRAPPLNVSAPPAAALGTVLELTNPIEPVVVPASGTDEGAAPARDHSIEPAVLRDDAQRSALTPEVGIASGEPAPHLNAPMMTDRAEDLSVIDEIANAGAAAILGSADVKAPVSVAGEDKPAEAASPSSLSQRQTPAPVTTLAPAVENRAAEPARIEPVNNRTLEAPAIQELAWNEEIQPLVSPSVGASVESSFQALASTLFLQNTTLVENMMRDMLRPMLKTWLDDNLPVIVERLVRAEIERVARGSRG